MAHGRITHSHNVSLKASGNHRHLKAELKRAGLNYEDLAERLKEHDIKETKATIANKLTRGAFPATFFLASLVAIGCEIIKLENI